MSADKSGGPAFPESYVGADRPHEGIGDGMTLRDYFAAKAMQSFISELDGPRDDHPGCPSWTNEQVADLAYAQADAMLKAREA